MKTLFAVAVALFLPSFSCAGEMQSAGDWTLEKGVTLTKIVDVDAQTACYILRPSSLHYQTQYDQGGEARAFDANAVGSISCVPVSSAQAATTKSNLKPKK